MIIQCEIQNAKTIPSKELGRAALVQLQIIDKSPPPFRSSGALVMFMGEDRIKDIFGKKSLVDQRVTVAVEELAPTNGAVKLRGQVVLGWHAAEAVEKEIAKQLAAVTPPEAVTAS